MNEEQELRALYKDAKASGRVDLQEKIIGRLEKMKMSAPANDSPIKLAPQLSKLDQRAMDVATADQDPVSKTIQTAGLGVRYYIDQAEQAVSNAAPDWFKEQFQKNVKVMSETPPGQVIFGAMQLGGELWDEVKKIYPNGARTAEDLVLLGSAAYGVKSVGTAVTKLPSKAKSWVSNAEKRVMEGYVAPYVNASNVRKTRKYWKTGDKKAPVFSIAEGTEYDKMLKALKTVPDVKEGMSNLQLRDALDTHLIKSADDIYAQLSKSGELVNRGRVKAMRGSIASRFNRNYLGAEKATAKEVMKQKMAINDVLKKYTNSDGTIRAADLLKARRDIDRSYSRAATTAALDPSAKATRKKDLWLATREAMNDTIEQVSGKKYKSEMRRQHNLYKVKDNVTEKADHEILMVRDRNEDMATRQARRVFAKTLLGGSIRK